MITKKITFVLGAGASNHLEFPLGMGLVEEIIRKFRDSQSGWRQVFEKLEVPIEECRGFTASLEDSHSSSVDAFLEERTDLMRVGKNSIVKCIMSHENKDKFRLNKSDNWYYSLYRILKASVESFGSNNLSIVTFNYDRSLEQFLYVSLMNSYPDISSEECAELMKSIPIVHVYGKIGDLQWENSNGIPYINSNAVVPEIIKKASDNIIIMPEGEETSSLFDEAHEILGNAEYIYFLGFGYNETNLKRLGIDKLKDNHNQWLGTSQGIGLQDREYLKRVWNISTHDDHNDILGFFINYVRFN